LIQFIFSDENGKGLKNPAAAKDSRRNIFLNSSTKIYLVLRPTTKPEISDTRDIKPVTKFLPYGKVEYLFGEDEDYTDIVAELMRDVGMSISGVSQFADTYRKYCQMVASTIKLNIEKTLASKALGPEDFRFLLTKHTEQINSMEAMTVSRRVNLFSFRGHEFQKAVLPYPNLIIKAIDEFMPQMAISRNEKLQETMRDALKMLDRDPASVEDFVEHLAVLTRINNDLPNLEAEFHTITRLFAIANEANLNIDPEQYAFFKSLGSIFHHLKSSLLYTEAQCEENIRRFTVDLQFLMSKVRSGAVAELGLHF